MPLRFRVAGLTFLRLITLCAAALTHAPAQSLGIELQPARTKIEFTLADVLHTVHGTFQLKSGHIDFNPDSKAISGLLLVDASSGESGSGARDVRMRRSILETDRYPEISFAPTMVEGDFSDALSTVSVTGWFTIHGERHQISVPVKVTVAGDNFAASGDFIVPYVRWGMKNPSTLFLRVKEQVDIKVKAAGTVFRHPARSAPL